MEKVEIIWHMSPCPFASKSTQFDSFIPFCFTFFSWKKGQSICNLNSYLLSLCLSADVSLYLLVLFHPWSVVPIFSLYSSHWRFLCVSYTNWSVNDGGYMFFLNVICTSTTPYKLFKGLVNSSMSFPSVFSNLLESLSFSKHF